MMLISLHFSFARDGAYYCTITQCGERAHRGTVMIVIDRNIKYKVVESSTLVGTRRLCDAVTLSVTSEVVWRRHGRHAKITEP